MKPHSSLIYPLHPSAKSADSAGSMAPQATNAPIQCRHCQGEHDRGYRSLGAGPSPASVEAWSTESALTMGKLHGVQKSRAWRLREMWSSLWLLRLGDQRVSHQSLLMEWITYGYSLSAFPQPACMACIANIKRHRRAGGIDWPMWQKAYQQAPLTRSCFYVGIFVAWVHWMHGGWTGKKDPTKDEWDTFHKGGAGECSVNRWSPRLFACKAPCKAHEGPCKLLWIPLWILWEGSKRKSWAVLQIDLQPLQNISSICPWFTKLKMVTFHCHVHVWEGRLVLLFLVPRLLQQFLAQPVRSGFELTP